MVEHGYIIRNQPFKFISYEVGSRFLLFKFSVGTSASPIQFRHYSEEEWRFGQFFGRGLANNKENLW